MSVPHSDPGNTSSTPSTASAARPPPQIVPVRLRDVPALAQIIGPAFSRYPMLNPLHPGEPCTAGAAESFVAFVARAALSSGTAMTTPQLQGLACWLSPERRSITTLGALRAGALGLAVRLGSRAAARFLTLGQTMDRVRNEVIPEPHHYLLLLGVAPLGQAGGIGTALLEARPRSPARMEYPVYLETLTEANAAYYRRRGFDLVAERPLPGGMTLYGLVRHHKRQPRAEAPGPDRARSG